MPAQAIGAGTISFGLVTIPIKVYSANRTSERISFNMLHEACSSRLRQQYVCPECEEVVERSEMVKGYEFAKNQYVLFSPEELKAIEQKATQTIEITEFLPKEAIDPIYFDKPYYLAPDKHGSRPYQLLTKAMEQTGRWALAKYAARGRQYLVLLRPAENGLVMQQLHYATEVRPISEIGLDEDVEIKQKELELAILLADQVTAEEFHPEEYRDEVRERLEALIERKVAGEEVSFVEEEAPKGEVIDLMEALRASLEGTSSRKGSTKKAAKTASQRKPARQSKRTKAASKKKSSKKAAK